MLFTQREKLREREREREYIQSLHPREYLFEKQNRISLKKRKQSHGGERFELLKTLVIQ